MWRSVSLHPLTNSWILACFDHTDGEYEEAVKLLTQTSYGKTQRLIQARLHATFDLDPPSPTAKALGKFHSLYEGDLRGLKSLGANDDEAGYVFSELLIRKLPSRIRDNLNRANISDFWTLEELRAEIDVEIGHLQNVDVDSPSDELSPHTSTAVFKSSYYIKLCQLCNENHFAINCTKYKTVDSKRAMVSELKLCFNFLRGSILLIIAARKVNAKCVQANITRLFAVLILMVIQLLVCKRSLRVFPMLSVIILMCMVVVSLSVMVIWILPILILMMVLAPVVILTSTVVCSLTVILMVTMVKARSVVFLVLITALAILW